MLTLFHSPNSRSSAVVMLLNKMGITDKVEVRHVSIKRIDGSGEVDPTNPHPEGKVPALLHDGHLITERGAIMLHLTTIFPETGLAPPVGSPLWGEYLTWLSWYQGVLEPVMVMDALGLEHPGLASTFRSHNEAAARIRTALKNGPWLLGAQFSAADLLVHSLYGWFKDAVPDDSLIRDWVARCAARPARLQVQQADALVTAKAA